MTTPKNLSPNYFTDTSPKIGMQVASNTFNNDPWSFDNRKSAVPSILLLRCIFLPNHVELSVWINRNWDAAIWTSWRASQQLEQSIENRGWVEEGLLPSQDIWKQTMMCFLGPSIKEYDWWENIIIEKNCSTCTRSKSTKRQMESFIAHKLCKCIGGTGRLCYAIYTYL